MAPSFKSLSRKNRRKVADILFQARLFREGKLEQYWEERAACKGTGAKFGTLECKLAADKARQVRRDYGWVGDRDEFARHEALKHAPLANRRKELMAEAARNKGRSGLDKAFDALPNKASNEVEISWVASHPRMRRAQEWKLQNPEDPPKPIKMTAADITSPSNGPCPSKVAYTTLVSWLADPDAFKKQMLSKQKDAATKVAESATETDATVSDDLEEVERLLKAASGNG